jgi:hypothetical protein
MGFFGSMRSINKIYSLLNVLEQQLIKVQDNTYSSRSYESFRQSVDAAISTINELSNLLQSSSSTVKMATFKFLDTNIPLAEILYVAHNFVSRAEADRRLTDQR